MYAFGEGQKMEETIHESKPLDIPGVHRKNTHPLVSKIICFLISTHNKLGQWQKCMFKGSPLTPLTSP